MTKSSDFLASHDFGVNQALVEELYHRWFENPSTVDEAWRRYFAKLTQDGAARRAKAAGVANGGGAANGAGTNGVHGNGATGTEFLLPATAEELPFLDHQNAGAVNDAGTVREAHELQGRVSALVNAYRVRGHLFAKLDPLGIAAQPPAELELEHYGLAHVDPGTEFATGDMAGPDVLPLAEINRRLRETYCRTIGVEFTFLDDPEQRRFLQQEMESTCNHLELSRDEKLRIYTKLTDAEYFEQFLHKKYLGAKRFSLEGAESFIPLLDQCIERSAEERVEEVVIGMAHRGRLNVFANILEMGFREIFTAFEDDLPEKKLGRGDVKYHLGHSSDRVAACGQNVHLTLCFNPSHLEFVNPVVEGRVRAKQDRRGDGERRRVMPILVHGDAAFAGQGVVPETLNLARLEGYKTGGTLHVVINNQIGFTTSPEDGRSTRYCTDITRMLRCPVFHVNGEDPEAVAQVAKLASKFRARFQQDVVIDLYCYRKHGHNEADEPRFTQPLPYKAVDAKRTVGQIYLHRLTESGNLSSDEAKAIEESRRTKLEAALKEARDNEYLLEPASMHGQWSAYRGGPDSETPDVDTAVPRDALVQIAERIADLPASYDFNPKIRKLLESRRDKVKDGSGLDWGTAEWLAFGSLLQGGSPVRITGQDARRGTFSHRHAVLYDRQNGNRYVPLRHLKEGQAPLEIYDSPLSEAGVLGFEFGYALDTPDALVIWEAQFGDFVNGAQVIIDQFISSSEDKWDRLSGVVMLLPHGFEGQGPEHSSGRMERFLALGAEDNIQVCNLTTPAQYFHCLRRQVVRPWRKPLVVMTPKSLLRHPLATSKLDALSEGGFRCVLPDTVAEGETARDPAKVRRVIMCSGKVYYDLAVERRKKQVDDVAIVRLEQLYPLRLQELEAVLAPYKNAEVVWVQEEPWNMGSWFFVLAHLGDFLEQHSKARLRCVARPPSASPATGSGAAHKLEQQALLDEALA